MAEWEGTGATPPAGTTDVAAAARRYIDSWHRGDADGMARSLHHDLVKRTVDREAPAGSGEVTEVTRSQMVEWTRDGGGAAPDTPVEIVVDHVEGDIASARVATPDYLDYVHLVRTDGGWRIVNDLYRLRST